MAFLHNRISHKELKEKLQRETIPRITLSFYAYFRIEEPVLFRDDMYRQLNDLKVFGRIYVAKEGINAQISIPEDEFEKFRSYIYSIQPLRDIRLNRAIDDDGKSFWYLKIKVRDKIVADGISDPAFSMEKKGRYLDAKGMNRMMDDPETIVIDMRNHYEYEVGHFENAREIPSDTFREQLPMAVNLMKEHKNKNIIMYCTGGIRCEKASAYLLNRGFKNVYHLEGGIIHYARQVKDMGLTSRFIGKNFVFDDRLGERITGDIIAHCHQCGKPADSHVNCSNDTCHLLFIQCDECREKMEGCCSEACREFLHLPEEKQRLLRKGLKNGQNIFSKSKKGLHSIASHPDSADA